MPDEMNEDDDWEDWIHWKTKDSEIFLTGDDASLNARLLAPGPSLDPGSLGSPRQSIARRL